MKNPLQYQTTEYDCGPTSMLNAVRFLFDRGEIPPEIPRQIMLYCLDCYGGNGDYGKRGTSQLAMMFLSGWLNQYAQVKKFPLHCEYLVGESVTVSENSAVVGALQQGGVVVVRLLYGCWHYVLLTEAKDGCVSFFDPYYRVRRFPDPQIEMITDRPAKYNRRVPYGLMNRRDRGVYALGPPDTREAVILHHTSRRRTAEKTIEYYL